jgi:putative ATPase
MQPRPPLAARMRPQELSAFHGQTHLLAPGKPLRLAIESGRLYPMILWGPPGSGKTSLAKLMASYIQAEFIPLSAVLIGVPALRLEIKKAELAREEGRATVLFLDEIHRFNKAQQDALLPYVENGTVILIGATTENPSFEINNALLSRARVHRLLNTIFLAFSNKH